MSDKIYEYKDDQDWYIGKWTDFNAVTAMASILEGDSELQLLKEELTALLAQEEKGFAITVIKKTSDFRLISFAVDMIASETKRPLKVTQHQGAVLVSEKDKLLLVHLPKGGTGLTKFFGDRNQSLGDTILIATHNEGKTKEFRQLFAQLGLKVENLNQYPDLPEVEETGLTFEENARLKAETIAKQTGKIVLADDSGLKVDILGGLPGVWSARFSGADATDQSNNAKLLHELAMVFDLKKRSAQFHTTLVAAKTGKESLVVEADWPGYIALEPRGENGFGYDPLFIVGETGKTSAELTAQEKNEISHRGQAVKKLMEAFPAWLNTHLS
ncbi:nucleoside-triphosphate diphosphatase [Streptococcus macacae]|uniref:dITP/XTP pyrophosphatase n=1 Tax=Streptococcus macacae NCTC 11558 TaxID=764298 RepID=G5JY73_9STRE|nr:nucleoside-triphosphate diphosphatase [Streptococcus macacae]EHJ51809.1 non-canonical purine NTP pyrophosphatase RdgB [Streptococcus macacae NCTC 11558]SUN77988.1 xanthosine triphosphate pyrophosphatase [Streptococcus macacae NCTC 11558]